MIDGDGVGEDDGVAEPLSQFDFDGVGGDGVFVGVGNRKSQRIQRLEGVVVFKLLRHRPQDQLQRLVS